MNTLAIIAALTLGQLGIVPEQTPVVRVMVFGAEWCGPCRMMKKEIERDLFKPGMGWKKYIEIINVDEPGPNLSYAQKNRLGEMTVPQVCITQDGIVVCRLFDIISPQRLAAVTNAIITTGAK